MWKRIPLKRMIILVALLAGTGNLARGEEISWQIQPSKIHLRGPESSLQLVITTTDQTGKTIDLTRSLAYSSDNRGIAQVSSTGRVIARGDGQTVITVKSKERTERIPVVVEQFAVPAPVSFRQDVIPILSKAGCNSGGCHGKAQGQNGFKISIFGSDPEADYDSLLKESRGRRIFFGAPSQSLLLRKATGQTAHGGGRKIDPDSLWYHRLERWIAEGAKYDQNPDQEIVKIAVYPSQLILSPRASQQFRVIAIDSSGGSRDVTAEAEFQSNFDAVAKVEESGLLQVSDIPGAAAILVRYMNHVEVCRVTVPRPDSTFRRPGENNFIDKLVWDQLQKLGISPSTPGNDSTFLRRVYLDTIGTLPTPAEARAFLADTRKDKRKRLIDQLLQREEYAEYWAMHWANLLRLDTDAITPQGTVAIGRWLKKQFRDNTPYDQFVRSILTARGNTLAESPASYFVAHKDAETLARSTSQIFLGVRIECAQCHHHPFERWGQKDYFALAGFFTGVKKEGTRILAEGGKDLNHPHSKQPVATAALGAEPAKLNKTVDRRIALADWMTARENPFFARMIANRLWAHYFGRGLIEPVDDLRATNPATNQPLLEALADHLVEVKYDLKAFTRTLLNSQVYQLSSEVNETNRLDDQNFSHSAWRPMPAEVLLDAICQTTKVAEKFNGWPQGYRAIQVWDNRMPSYFLKIFGRPARTTVCACERGTEPSIAQALHLMNAQEIGSKIRHRDGWAAELAGSKRSPEQIIEELYLGTLARLPSQEEQTLMGQVFAEADRREATEDILWTIFNTKEFIFNH